MLQINNELVPIKRVQGTVYRPPGWPLAA